MAAYVARFNAASTILDTASHRSSHHEIFHMIRRDDSDQLSPGVIAGIVVVSMLATMLISLSIMQCHKFSIARRRQKEADKLSKTYTRRNVTSHASRGRAPRAVSPASTTTMPVTFRPVDWEYELKYWQTTTEASETGTANEVALSHRMTPESDKTLSVGHGRQSIEEKKQDQLQHEEDDADSRFTVGSIDEDESVIVDEIATATAVPIVNVYHSPRPVKVSVNNGDNTIDSVGSNSTRQWPSGNGAVESGHGTVGRSVEEEYWI